MKRKLLEYHQILPYSMMAIPLAFMGLPLYMHAPKFYVEEYGVSIGLIGLLLLALRFIDAVQDPFLGYVSDKYNKHHGFIISLAALMLVCGITILFMPHTSAHIFWFTFSMFITATGFSLLTIILSAIGGVWSDDYYNKTKITSSREAMILISVLIAAVLPNILTKSFHALNAFELYAIIAAGITVLFWMIFMLWYKKQNFSFQQENKQMSYFSFMKTKQHRFFFLTFLFNSLAAAFPLITFLFFIDYYLEAPSWSGKFLSIYFLSAVASMPVWHALTKYKGKHLTWVYAMLLAIFSFAWVLQIGQGDVVCFAIICLISGFALGADFSLPPSILSDILDETDSKGAASLQFSVQAFLGKVALAFASFVVFLILEMVGYDGERNFQNQNVLETIKLLYVLPALGFKIIAAALLLYWNRKIGEPYEVLKVSNSVNGGRHVV